jgi:hypothetical protein
LHGENRKRAPDSPAWGSIALNDIEVVLPLQALAGLDLPGFRQSWCYIGLFGRQISEGPTGASYTTPTVVQFAARDPKLRSGQAAAMVSAIGLTRKKFFLYSCAPV